MNDDKLLFVYGTLRRDCPSGAHLQFLNTAEFVGRAHVSARLYLVSYYPALVPASSSHRVIGEVYRLPATNILIDIDEYEGCSPANLEPPEYRRTQIMVTMADGTQVNVWTYIYVRSTDGLRELTSGDFLQES